MKLIVHRQLSGGIYVVDFSVSDFTPEEVKKMESFGVPVINMMHDGPNNRRPLRLQLTRMAPQFRASFLAEDEAKAYEDQVVTQIRAAMQTLRERKDEFTSTQEVDV
jgi:hypothetical protein